MEGARELPGTIAMNRVVEVPSACDVATGLLHPRLLPRVLVCESWVFRIEVSGRIDALGRVNPS